MEQMKKNRKETNEREAIGQELIYAIVDKKYDEVQSLIDRGADVNYISLMDSTPLQWAVIRNSIPTVNLLLDNGADVNLRPTNGHDTPLIHAIKLSNIEMIKLLIARHADINLKNELDQTPIFCACASFSYNYLSDEEIHKIKRLEIVKLLLEFGADPFIKNNEGVSAMDIIKRNSELNEIYINNNVNNLKLALTGNRIGFDDHSASIIAVDMFDPTGISNISTEINKKRSLRAGKKNKIKRRKGQTKRQTKRIIVNE